MKLSSTQLLLTLLSQATAHILLIYPPPRINRGDLNSFDTTGPNVCNENDGCDSFCGVSINEKNAPITELPVKTDIEFKWMVTVPHENSKGEFKYRISLNGQGDGDANFDDPANLIGYGSDKNFDASKGDFGEYTFTGRIPTSFLDNCSDPASPCALQLFDGAYYVSCANVVLVAGEDGANTSGGGGGGGGDSDGDGDSVGQGTNNNSGSNNNNGNGQSGQGSGGGNNNGNNGQSGQGSDGGDDQDSTEPLVDLYPEGTLVNGTFVEHSVKLANSTGSDDLGFCPDISGSSVHGNLSCYSVQGGSCQAFGTETSFGYRDSETNPAIYATHFGGYSEKAANASECAELPTVYDTPGCLTAYGMKGIPQPFTNKNIQEGARVGLFECSDSPTQRFFYTHTGKFQILHPKNKNVFCLGMGEEITPTPDGSVERELKLMSCNETVTDPQLITWQITPPLR
jgi:hypothetical protein